MKRIVRKVAAACLVAGIVAGPALAWERGSFIEPEDVVAYRAGEQIHFRIYFHDVAARRCRQERAKIVMYIGNTARKITLGYCSSAGGGTSVSLGFAYRVQPEDQGIPCVRANALPFNVLWPFPVSEGQPPGVSHDGFCSEYPVNGGSSIYPPNAVRHHLPLLHSGSGFLRILNRSGDTGDVWITGADDAGNRTNRVTLTIGQSNAVNLSVQDLENGNPGKGLHGGIGEGEGHWQLEIVSALNILPLAYVRNPNGSIAPMRGRYGGQYVPFFNPAANTRQQSLLRLVNPSDERRSVWISALHDNCIEIRDEGCEGGESLASWTAERTSLQPYTSSTFTAQELVNTPHTSSGFLPGKYRLFIYHNRPITVMNLLRGPDGNLTDLSF